MRSVREIFKSHAVFNAEGKHIWGTDRESNHHYGDAYELMFDGTFRSKRETGASRESVKLMLEVGVADGSSLFAWREIFPNALIVGMDLEPIALGQTVMDRIEHHIGDQRIQEDCERVASGRKFDLIVDDASHQLPDVLLSLFWLWPFVRPGGLYVIEDLGIELCSRFQSLYSTAYIVGTSGPYVENEPLIVLRKPL